MNRFNTRDLVAGLIIMFLLGILVGQKLPWTGSAAQAQNQPPAAQIPVGGARTSFQESFADVAERVIPAVVNINSTRIISGREYYNPLADYLFGEGWMKEPDQSSQSLGSGVLVSREGVVVTNNHNIAGADEVRVTLGDGREFVAEIAGRDSGSDLAVLRIKGDNLPAAPWGDSDRLRVGDWILAVGNPFSFSQTVTAGIVSAKGRRDLGITEFEEFIQTDAAINPGNSGGAMVNASGEVVGINTAIFSKTGGYQGIGFAIPSNIAQANVAELLEKGRIVRGWIGLMVQPVTDRLAYRLGLNSAEGVVIVYLYPGHPAAAAGLRRGDVVTAVDGVPVANPRALRLAVATHKPGDSVQLAYYRNGQKFSLDLELVEQPMRSDGSPHPGI